MKSIAEIQEKIDEFRKYASQDWKKMHAENDIYKKLPIKCMAERLESAANALEWVIENH